MFGSTACLIIAQQLAALFVRIHAQGIPIVPENEINALHDLFVSTKGNAWKWQGTGKEWDFSELNPNPCFEKWEGITCNDSDPNISNILEVQLQNYNMCGRLPLSLGDMRHLQNVDFGSNHLTGTVPHTLSDCKGLTAIAINDNQLSGSVSEILEQCTLLSDIYLQGNHLTGSIPNPGPGWSSLNLNDNLLTGTIPNITWSRVTTLIASDNSFSGPLPTALFESPYLFILKLHGNHLTGTLPLVALSGGPKTFIVITTCGMNHLTGTIPDTFGEALNLRALDLGGNYLSGPIRASFVDSLPHIGLLYLERNQFSGRLPRNWTTTASTLSYLFLDSNRLTGRIPVSLGHLPRLQSLNLSNNRLTGTIPSSFLQLTALRVLMLQNNALCGNLTHVFNASGQQQLTTVQLSGNRFTGPVPTAPFLLPALQSFAAVGNCLEGPLPVQAICNSSTLNALVLDALHSSVHCGHPQSRALYRNGIELGTVPPCFLQMVNLTTLHLSDNGLTGRLPELATVSDRLTDLSLSHNLLVGSIPGVLLSRNWAKLDLSYNRLTGTLSGAQKAPYGNTTQLYVQHNRLSGVIPGSMHHVTGELSLLVGNLFSCAFDRTDLPSQDKNSAKYLCGSDAVNSPLFAWLACAAVVAAIIGTAARTLRWTQTVAVRSPLHLPGGLQRILDASHLLCVLALMCAVYCVVVMLPIYVSSSSYHATYQYQFAWTASGAYLSGVLGFALEATFLLLQLVLCGIVVDQPRLLRACAVNFLVASHENILHATVTWPQVVLYSLYLLFNLSVVVGVNVGFVIATLNLNGRALTAMQIMLSVFKLGFNNVVAPAVQRRISVRLERGGRVFTQQFAAVQLFVALFNNICIPCIVVALISPDCFYDALEGSGEVVSSYQYSGTCTNVVSDYSSGYLALNCAQETTEVDRTAYFPSFAYSYQCSSSFITYYGPTFVTMCIISGFLIPAQHLLLLWLPHHLSPTSRLYALVLGATPRLLQDPLSIEEVAQSRSDPLAAPLFDANQLMLSLLTYLALLLTFGALFPPLAVCCAAAMVSITVAAQLSVRRYLSTAEATKRSDCTEYIESSCREVGTPGQMRIALDLVLTVSCLFYTMFLFDTLGDAVGFSGSYWVFIVVPLLPACLLALRSAVVPKQPEHVAPTAQLHATRNDDAELDVELVEVAASRSVESHINPIHNL